MRRDFKTRKRNKIKLKELNNKALIATVAVSLVLVILIILYFIIFKNYLINKGFENSFSSISKENSEEVFSLSKISVMSSATADANIINQSYWNLDISQYSDIGIYLNNYQSQEISSIYIDNIEISTPELGTPYIYLKDFSELGNLTLTEENLIKDRTDIPIPEDLSKPICLGFCNKNVKTNFIFSSEDNTLSFDGTILKVAGIAKTSIKCNVNFNFNIITADNVHYVCNINIDIPLEDSNSNSIYDKGYIITTFDNLENYKFLKLN